MVNSPKRAHMIELFDYLLNFSLAKDSNKRSTQLIALVHHCLRIVSVIGEQSGQAARIGQSLSLIAPRIYKNSLHENLLYNFEQLEGNLAEELRGFSSLLDLVLEESSIRIDTDHLHNEVPQRYQAVATIFKDLHRELDAHSCLNLAFGSINGDAMILLFLRALTRVIRVIASCDELRAHKTVARWLPGFMKNRAVLETFVAPIDYTNPEQVAEFCLEYEFAQEVLTVFLCIASAQGLSINKTKAQRLDQALCDADLLGIAPFIESGFIAIQS